MYGQQKLQNVSKCEAPVLLCTSNKKNSIDPPTKLLVANNYACRPNLECYILK